MCLVGAVVAAGSLAFGAAGSVAAGKSHKHHKPALRTVKATCKLVVTVTVPSGDTAVTPPAESGTEFGSSACNKGIGRGVFADSFVLQDSGDLTGKFTQFAGAGSLHGTFDLAQPDNSAPPTAYDFGNEDLAGTFIVKGGTGAFAKAKGKATVLCASTDSVHYTCIEKLTLKLPLRKK
jgi:hypothetical protein